MKPIKYCMCDLWEVGNAATLGGAQGLILGPFTGAMLGESQDSGIYYNFCTIRYIPHPAP